MNGEIIKNSQEFRVRSSGFKVQDSKFEGSVLDQLLNKP